jgi:hypothetical protein
VVQRCGPWHPGRRISQPLVVTAKGVSAGFQFFLLFLQCKAIAPRVKTSSDSIFLLSLGPTSWLMVSCESDHLRIKMVSSASLCTSPRVRCTSLTSFPALLYSIRLPKSYGLLVHPVRGLKFRTMFSHCANLSRKGMEESIIANFPDV